MAIAVPAIGDPTKRSFAQAIVDGISEAGDSTAGSGDIPNGSFETDEDVNGIPDAWDRTLFTGGSLALDVTTPIHGAVAVKFTSPGGAGTGGGYLQSTDFLLCSENRPVGLAWQHKSSVATLRDKVELLWYDKAQGFLSSSAIYTSITNPTVWTLQNGTATPPAGARFFKIRITGADDSVNQAGDSYWDDFRTDAQISNAPSTQTVFAASGNWTALVTRIRVRAWGGGGGGSSPSGVNGGGGGGGGAYAEAILSVVPGTIYAITIGNGGAVGAVGTATTFAALLSAGGGAAGVIPTGGAGGTSAATINISGDDGGTANAGAAGAGGDAAGGGGNGGKAAGGAGKTPGGGGGGGNGSGAGTTVAAAGAAGRLIIEY